MHNAARKSQEKGIQAILSLNSKLHEKHLEAFDVNLAGGV